MKLLITGLSHHTAPVEVRERLAFEENTLLEALDKLRHRPGMIEGMILSTCNRVEVAVTAEEQSDAEGSIERFLAESRRVERDWVSPYLYRYHGPDAIRHLFRVASSLDSMVVGEPQILGQLKSAYALAKECGAISGYLDLVMTRAFNVAKRVRTETGLAEGRVSTAASHSRGTPLPDLPKGLGRPAHARSAPGRRDLRDDPVPVLSALLAVREARNADGGEAVKGAAC